MLLHVIPVPSGWSAEQAWEFISHGRKLTRRQRSGLWWAVVEVDADGRMVREHPPEDE